MGEKLEIIRTICSTLIALGYLSCVFLVIYKLLSK